MSVLTPPPGVLTTPAAPEPDGQRLLVHAMDWDAYVAIGELFRDRPAFRLTYDRGRLEFMTTSRAHELFKQWIGRIIETLAEEFHLPLGPAGNMTFQRRDLDRGLEPDQCYWIANEPQMRGRMEWLPEQDPPPDLIVEIEVSRSAINRMNIYAALGCPEVWRFDGETLRCAILQPDRSYQLVDRSPTFPTIPLSGIVPYLQPGEPVEFLSNSRAFRTWVQQQMAATPPPA
jgi:Uma2 family endonuclease